MRENISDSDYGSESGEESQGKLTNESFFKAKQHNEKQVYKIGESHKVVKNMAQSINTNQERNP
jgi:hypothetical protein